MADRDLAHVEDALRDLARSLDVPATPDVRTAVRAALATDARPVPARPRLRQRAVAVLAAVAVALASLLVVSPAARAAAVDLLRFAGIDLRDEPAPAPPGPGTLPGETPTALEAARNRVRFPIVVPAALGPPDRAAVSDDGRVVTLTYDATPARPAVRIDESADGLEPFFAKFVEPALAERVSVGVHRGLWIRTPHDVAYVDASGRVRPETVRLSARTLVWSRAGVTVRLEGLATKEAALVVARSMR